MKLYFSILMVLMLTALSAKSLIDTRIHFGECVSYTTHDHGIWIHKVCFTGTTSRTKTASHTKFYPEYGWRWDGDYTIGAGYPAPENCGVPRMESEDDAIHVFSEAFCTEKWSVGRTYLPLVSK